MGCDFYIRMYLEIHHNNGISYYEFPTMRGYFCELDRGIFDSDEDENHDYNSVEYDTLYENMKIFYLTPRKPILIYNNHSFTSPRFEMKYLPILQEKINKTYVNKYSRHKDTGTFTGLEQVIKVIKKEERYEPGINLS
jgi:hypothetical protein